MSPIKSLNPRQAWSVLQTNPSAVLLDVRDKIEFAFGAAPPTRK